MKQILIIIIILIFGGCKPNLNKEIIKDKYINGFYGFKYTLANERLAKKDQGLLALIDNIIEQTKNYKIKYELRKKIVVEVLKMSIPTIDHELQRYKNLRNKLKQFEVGRSSLLEDLNFIDLFLIEKYWQHWSCDLST